MKTGQWLLMSGVAVFLLAGCRSTQLMMVNDLGEDAVVSLQGPGQISPDPPTLEVANTGNGVFKLETPVGDLPANYQWQAGGRTGTVIVTDNSPKRQVLNLSTGVPAARTVIEQRGGASASVDMRVNP